MELDFDRCYRAVDSRDARFDGWFVTAVKTTGIYCRPSCPAATPKPRNVTFFPTAAAAHRLGFRACRRCRPDASPGSPAWDIRADVVARAMRMIVDGVVDRDGVDGLAKRVGFGTRHLTRMLVDQVGAGPLALARAQRAQTARTLIETTNLPLAEIAFAAGFGSVRQFNETVREVYATRPSQMRAAAARSAPTGAGTIAVRLAYRPPLHAGALLDFLALRAIPGVEIVTTEHYMRALRLPHGDATVMLTPLPTYVAATLHLADVRDLAPAVARCRRLLDLDADPIAIDGTLADDPHFAAAVAAEPGVRVPRAVDGFEIAARAIVGQQISVPAAITVLRRLVEAATRFELELSESASAESNDSEPGTSADNTDPTAGIDAVTDTDQTNGIDLATASAARAISPTMARSTDPAEHTDLAGGGLRPFPTAATIAMLPDEAFRMPRRRRETIRALAKAVASGDLMLDSGADRAETEAALRALPGVGEWTAAYIAMRALGDPDVFLSGDLAIQRAAARVGLPSTAADLASHARRWSPWRSYAMTRLWRM